MGSCRHLASEAIPKRHEQGGGFGALQPPAMNCANGSFGGEKETSLEYGNSHSVELQGTCAVLRGDGLFLRRPQSHEGGPGACPLRDVARDQVRLAHSASYFVQSNEHGYYTIKYAGRQPGRCRPLGALPSSERIPSGGARSRRGRIEPTHQSRKRNLSESPCKSPCSGLFGGTAGSS